ncbi:hypothetical protein QTP88_000958 [Uroleucon formosanum]
MLTYELPEDDAKKKWKNLRDTFLRETKKVKKSRSGDAQESAEIYTGKWIYYKSMLFLKDTTTPRDTEGNVSEEDQSEVEENNEHMQSPTSPSFVANTETDDFSVPSVSSVLDSNISNESDVLASATQEVSSKKSRKKQENISFENELLKLETQKLSALLQSNKDQTIPDDEDMLFLKSLHPYFHNLTNIQKLKIRNQMESIFINELSTQPLYIPSNSNQAHASNDPNYLYQY